MTRPALLALAAVLWMFGIAEAPMFEYTILLQKVREVTRAERLYEFCVVAQQRGDACL